MNITRSNYYSELPIEAKKGYARAVNVNPFIYLGGSTSIQPDGSVYGDGDSYIQTKYVLEKLISFVEKAGGCAEDVVSIKFYATPDYDREKGMLAYHEIFNSILPAFTLVTVHSLALKAQVVEIDLTAIAGSSKGAEWEGISLKRENFLPDISSDAGYSQMVKVGPFVYIGGISPITDNGTVEGIKDSNIQEDIILSKGLELLALAGGTADDLVKAKMYITPDFKKFDTNTGKVWADNIKSIKPLFTKIVVEELTAPEQLAEVEMMAVIGCGGDDILPSWGNVDFRRQNIASTCPAEVNNGFSRIVKTGPFVFSAGTTTMQPDQTVLYENDSVGQESYIVEKLLILMGQADINPTDVIEVKAYRTPDYKSHINADAHSYYEKALKPVTPLYTAVTITDLVKPEQLVAIEMMAVVGCGK